MPSTVSDTGPVWIALLDLEAGQPTGISGPLLEHATARVLVRMHKAPIGYVTVPAVPEETLAERIRSIAGTTLSSAISRHTELDALHERTTEPESAITPQDEWAAAVCCPLRYHSGQQIGLGMTVVICTRDRTESLRSCLTALREISYEPAEIVVVDNAPSSDETWQMVTALAKEDPRIRYVRERLPGLSRARNRGMAEARFDLVAFTDDDTQPCQGWLAAIAAGFESDPQVVCVTGPVAPSSLETPAERFYDARIGVPDVLEPRRFDLTEYRDPARLYPYVASVFGAGTNFALRRDAAEAAGGFDLLLGAGAPCRGAEGLDMFLRLVLAGGRVCYLPAALVWHRQHADLRSLRRQMYSHGHGLGAYVMKHVWDRPLLTGLLGHGPSTVAAFIGHARTAANSTELGPARRGLVLAEAFGVATGAAHYVAATRWPKRLRPAKPAASFTAPANGNT
jgi:GT2 family glycosyltransferase